MPAHRSVAVAAALAFSLGVPAGALAQGDPKAQAAAHFKDGEKAFKRHDYAAAAKAFEKANELAPHPAALFNAAAAHQKAGQLTLAANLCARYLRDAPEDDSRREKANALIGELTPKVGRIQITDRGAKNVELDGNPVDAELIYVDPGDHSVTGEFGGKTVQRKITVVAGSIVKVALDPPKRESQPLEEDTPPPDQGEKPKDTDKSEKPLGPTLFYVGVGLTGVLGGVTVWSGLDTNKARQDYDAEPTPEGLDDGRAKQRRTNVLLGATAVAGVGTAVVGLFLTDFKRGAREKPPDSELGLLLSPRFIGARGSF